MTGKIKVTELDFQQIKNNLKDFLRSQDRFRDFDFEGSNLSVLLDILSYNTAYNAFYANMIANEMFLDTAIKRDSIVSRAKAIGYTPYSRRSARALVQVEFLSVPPLTTEVIAQRGEKFIAADGVTRTIFTVERTTVVTPNSEGRFIGEIPLIQGIRLEHRWTYDVSSPLPQRFIIPNDSVDTTSINVRVQQSETSTVQTNFYLNTDINLVDETTPVFFLTETEEGRYEISFGDGVVGKPLEDGNIIIIDYVITEGEVANAIRVFKQQTSIGGYSRLNITTINPSQGGADRESEESVRRLAPLYHESQNRAVTRNDYETLIKKDFPEIEYVRVWGGEDNDPPIYGKVFLSLKPFGTLVLSTDRKQQLINQIIRERNLVSIEVEVTDPDFLQLVINSNVRYNPRATSLSEGDVQKAVINAIRGFREQTLKGFNSSFRYSQLISDIDSADVSILDNLTEVTMRYRLRPPLNFSDRYVIKLNNPIDKGDSANNVSAINSTGFLINGMPTYIADNGKGSLYYYRLVANQRVVFRSNVGAVNYSTGEIILDDFFVQGFVGSGVTYVDIFATPGRNDIIPQRNQIILIDNADIHVQIDDDVG